MGGDRTVQALHGVKNSHAWSKLQTEQVFIRRKDLTNVKNIEKE